MPPKNTDADFAQSEIGIGRNFSCLQDNRKINSGQKTFFRTDHKRGGTSFSRAEKKIEVPSLHTLKFELLIRKLAFFLSRKKCFSFIFGCRLLPKIKAH